MNKVMSSYFDDAHRGLQRQRSDVGRSANPTASSILLPPLRGDSNSPPLTADVDSGLKLSSSVGGIDFSREFSHERAAEGVQADRFQQALQENSKLSRKLRSLQEQLSISSAKKEAFKAQAQKLEKEFKKGREQADALQGELLDAKREAGQRSKEAQEAIDMMTEMRKAHIMEVRLLQRGLASRGNDDKMKNRVTEVADLVDKIGRAVVQRDEAIRDKTKMQAQLGRAVEDLRSVTEENARLKKQNRQLQDNLKEAQRKAKFNVPKPQKDPGEYSDDSDEDFANELATLEKRFEILEEGPAGLDILASNLSKDKQGLEKRLKQQAETVKSLHESIDEWKRLNQEKDHQVDELNLKIETILRDQAIMEEQIAQKRREIELQVEEEKALLRRRASELESERDQAVQGMEGMEKVSTRLTKELVKVHGQYTGSPNVEEEGIGDGDVGDPEAATGSAVVADSVEASLVEPLRAEGESPQPPEAEQATDQAAEHAIEQAEDEAEVRSGAAIDAEAPPEVGNLGEVSSGGDVAPDGAQGAEAETVTADGAPVTGDEAVQDSPGLEAPDDSLHPSSSNAPGADRRGDERGSSTRLARQVTTVKTGQELELEVHQIDENNTELRAREVPEGQEWQIPIDTTTLELDAEDPWADLFSRVGVSFGPPRQVVIASLVGRREVNLPPHQDLLILTIFMYDSRCYHVSGIDLSTQKMTPDLIVDGELLKDLEKQIDGCSGVAALFDLLVSGLTWEADNLRLSFSAAAAVGFQS
mmetsp:Transcript_36945/g.81094  ORF Transcript_36945/g.81094 Transcript_36945/m.81094 type:complete len:760 (-) Transcript_36945:14-2293(-)